MLGCVCVWGGHMHCGCTPGHGLECDLKCAFYQSSKLLQPKDGRARTHRGQMVVGPEYEFSSLHSEQRMGWEAILPAHHDIPFSFKQVDDVWVLFLK